MCCIDAMAECSKKPNEMKVKTSIDLERLKRSPYLVAPILSPRHRGTGVRVRNHPWLAISVEQPKAKDSKPPHRDRGEVARATTNIHDEDAGKTPAKDFAVDDHHQAFKASSIGTKQYFSALECQLRSAGIDHNHNSTKLTAPHNQRKKRFEAHSVHEYHLAGGQLAPFKCSDFIGPVKVQEVGDGMGRGLVVTADVEPGDLLLVSNPLAKLCKHETEMVSGGVAEELSDLPTATNVLHEHLIRVLCAKASNSSHDRALLSRLCKQKGEILSVPSMSIFCRGESATTSGDEQTPSGNVIGANDGDSEFRLLEQEIKNVAGVVRYNAFGHAGVYRESENELRRSWTCGIWMTPSFINHSCTPNCAMMLVGDVAFVVATRKLQLGSQVTVAYFHVFRPLHERRESMRRWDFECQCKRCELEESLHDPLVVVCKHLKSTHMNDMNKHMWLQSNHMDTWTDHMDLVKIAELVQEVLTKEGGLSNLERSWIRASFVHAYMADKTRSSVASEKNPPSHITHLELALESAEAVCRGHIQTLEIAATLWEREKTSLGGHSFLVKAIYDKALNCCRCVFGRQSQEVLHKLLKAAAASALPPEIVFLGRN